MRCFWPFDSSFGPVAHDVVDLQHLGDGLDARLHLLPGLAQRRQTAHDVVVGRHMREQREVLERDADAARLGRIGRGVLPADIDLAGLRLLDAGDDAQQHGLAAARWAEHGDDLAGVDGQRQAVHRLAGLEGLADVPEFELGHGQPFTAPSDRPSTR